MGPAELAKHVGYAREHGQHGKSKRQKCTAPIEPSSARVRRLGLFDQPHVFNVRHALLRLGRFHGPITSLYLRMFRETLLRRKTPPARRRGLSEGGFSAVTTRGKGRPRLQRRIRSITH